MGKKGETGVNDRSKPQPEKKKERDDKRKKKKSARLERQQSRRLSQTQFDAHKRFQFLLLKWGESEQKTRYVQTPD